MEASWDLRVNMDVLKKRSQRKLKVVWCCVIGSKYNQPLSSLWVGSPSPPPNWNTTPLLGDGAELGEGVG